MPQEESLSVRFLGDNSSLDKASKAATKSLDKVEATTEKVTKNLQKNIVVTEKVSRAAANLAKSSGVAGGALDKTSKSSGAATQSLINLSRVAQDAPFGFIGIANNLNPLLESFQRLKVEAKATGTSLSSALKGALTGPAGIGLALGVVSSLLVVFGDRLFNAKSGAEKTADAIKKAKDMLRDYEESLGDVSRVNLVGTQDAQGELGKLRTLYNAAVNVNIPLAKRKQIVDELQAQYPKYFANIKDETILAGGAAEAYNNLTAQILASSKARAAQELIVSIQKDLLTVEQQITDNRAQRIQLEANYQRKVKNDRTIFATTDELGRQVGSIKESDVINSNINDKLREGNKLIDQRYELQKRVNAVSSLLADIVEKAPDSILPNTSALKSGTTKKGEFNFFDKFFDFDYNGKLSEKQTSSLLDAANAFAKEFGSILEGLNFDRETQPASLNAAKEFWRNYRNGIVKLKPQTLIDDITVQPPQIKLADGSQQIDDLLQSIQQGFDKFNPNNVGILPDTLERQRIETLTRFEKLYRDIGLELPIIIKQELENGLSSNVKVENIPTLNLAPALSQNLAQIVSFTRTVQAAFQQMGTMIASSFGEAIGTALTGGNIGDVFRNLFTSLGGVVQQLGQQIIQLGVIAQVAQKAIANLLKNPAAALAVGVALTALGTAMKNIKPPGFAQGGLVYGPTLGLVGEGRGTTRSNPEVIAPLDKLAQYIGGGGGDRLVHTIRGNDLELLLVRNGKRNGRVR